MNVQEINVQDIDTNLIVNCRKNVNVDDLKESIQDSGIQIPIGVSIQENGRYGLIYGFRRFTACTELGMETIPARIVENKEEADLLVMNLQENVSRQNLSPMEEALAVQRIINAGRSVDQFRVALGWTKTIVTQRLALLEMSAPIQTALEKDTISVNQARAIQDADENHHDVLIELAENGGTVKALKEEVESLKGFSPVEDDEITDFKFDDDEQSDEDFQKEIDREDAKALAEANSNLVKSQLLDCGAKVIEDNHAWFAYQIAIDSIEFNRLPKAELVALVNAIQTLAGEHGLNAWGEGVRRK
jgi:ParB/RepB/Spo0J family partition protein